MQFGHGTLVAMPDFEGDFLFVIGIDGSCKVPQGSCNIDINFPELFLDGAHVASGMQINNVMGVTIGPGGYFLNFTQYGLQINHGHEVMMERCWLGETNFDFDHEKYNAPPNATAIQINGNDHFIFNTIIFSSKIGVEVNGAADYVSAVHVWFPFNHAVHYPDTKAFHVTGSGNRFTGCYIDGGRAVFAQNALSRNTWTNGFECCQNGAAAVGTPGSGIVLVGKSVGPGLQIVNNEFGGGQISHALSMGAMAGATAAAAGRSHNGEVCKGADALNISVANDDCQGLSLRQGDASSSVDACRAACCADASCSVYQFCGPGGKCTGATGTASQCWTGAFADCVEGGRHGWQGSGGVAAPDAPIPIAGVRIAHNANSGGVQKGTSATLSLTQKAATQWSFDFCDRLVWPQIAIARAHVVAASGFPATAVRPPDGCKVLVETDVPVTGTVTVDVDSSEPSSKFV